MQSELRNWSTPLCRRAPIGLVMALVVVLASLMPGASGPAHAADFGDGTGRAPNTNYGCEAGPRVADAFGTIGVFPSGTDSCTWLQLPTLGGGPSGATPQTGRVTAVRVRSGANPAPVRFTVVRFISGVDASGHIIPNSTQCCFGQAMTQTFQLQPNAVTGIPLNLPVVNGINLQERVAITDFVGISATSGQGTLPVALTVDRAPTTADYAVPGTPQVSLHYPEIAPGQVRTDGFAAPAHLITARFTMCTGGNVAPRGVRSTLPRAKGDQCGGRITTNAVNARAGKAKFPIRCVGSCSGRIEVRRATGNGKLAKTTTFRVGTGGQREVTVRLTKAGKRATRGERSVRAKVVLRAQGSRVSRTVTLR